MKPLADRLAELRVAVEPCDKEAAALLLEVEGELRGKAGSLLEQASSADTDPFALYASTAKWSHAAAPGRLPVDWDK